jgi:hypothetical protein
MSLLAIVLVMLIAACSANSTETFSEVGGALGSGDGADAGREVTREHHRRIRRGDR